MPGLLYAIVKYCDRRKKVEHIMIFKMSGLIVIIACLFIASCEDNSGPYTTYFHMRVDSISMPEEVMQTDTLEIMFYATLPSCCYNFHRFEAQGYDHQLNIKMIGKLRHNIPCCTAMKYIEEVYRLDGLLTGYFYVNVEQPDKTSIIDSVLILR
jgi:hypothetical protein